MYPREAKIIKTFAKASVRKEKIQTHFIFKATPFFFVYCRMRFLILGRSVRKEKQKKNKNKIGKGGPVLQHNIRGD